MRGACGRRDSGQVRPATAAIGDRRRAGSEFPGSTSSIHLAPQSRVPPVAFHAMRAPVLVQCDGGAELERTAARERTWCGPRVCLDRTAWKETARHCRTAAIAIGRCSATSCAAELHRTAALSSRDDMTLRRVARAGADDVCSVRTIRAHSLTSINAASPRLTGVNMENAPVMDFPRIAASAMTYIKPAVVLFRRGPRSGA